MSCRIILAWALIACTGTASAVIVNYASGALREDQTIMRDLIRTWEQRTGHTVNIITMPSSSTEKFSLYRLWLAAHNEDVDVYELDIIWPAQLADQFIDLRPHVGDVIDDHFPSIVAALEVGQRLVAIPFMTAAPALYYRTDLLEQYDARPPRTWQELTATAQRIQDAERAAGNENMWGYAWQGSAYEGLTCNALEWIASSGGGLIVEPDGTISINNAAAARAVDLARSWISTISPPGVLAYREEEARGIWQSGNAVFMRNWTYAYALGASPTSPIRGKYGVAPLPHGEGQAHSAATLGGWNFGVSKYSPHPEAAIDLVRFMASIEVQKVFAIRRARMPSIAALYDDPEVAAAQPIIPLWKDVFMEAVVRPSAPTRRKYNEVSARFWSAVHEVLSGNSSAAQSLERLEADLETLRGEGWAKR